MATLKQSQFKREQDFVIKKYREGWERAQLLFKDLEAEINRNKRYRISRRYV